MTGKNKRFQENSASVKIITNSNAPRKKSKLTRELPTLETVKIYFGTYLLMLNFQQWNQLTYWLIQS